MMHLLALQKKANEAFPGSTITASHLLFIWASGEDRMLSRILFKSGLRPELLKKAVRPLMEEPIEEDKQIVTECIHGVSRGSVTGWHLLRTLYIRPTCRITKTLIKAGMNIDGLKAGLDAHVSQKPLTALNTKASRTSDLLKWGRDLTKVAATGAFNDLYESPTQMESLLQILQRKEKANPVLTGHAGVGKTALVELLARELANGKAPKRLDGTRLFDLSMGKLVSGTRYRGEFEERFQAVMKGLRQAEPAILFIDEFHLVWGAGRAEGAPMDAANLLKPLINRGSLRIIGATTAEEYHRYIARDPALARRFEELRLEEPGEELLMNMVGKQREGLEAYHGITIPDSMLSCAIHLTNRHLPNRHQPDKTISLLDSSAVRTANQGATDLSEDDLLHTLERQTGRSISKLGDSQRLSLLDMGDGLRGKIIGQDEAIEKVAATLIYRRQHLGEAERNLGSFLFVGSTGVGKTELARSLAIVLFGDEKHLLHLDMSEYGTFGATNKLIGSSRIFADSEDGVLARWLYSQGSGVILFDEIEKASQEIRYLLLGMLDRGRIRDARGEEMDTRQCVIVLTSNALKPEMLKKESIGFSEANNARDAAELLSFHFPPEFLGRIDEIIMFNDLKSKELKKILNMRMEEGLSRFRQTGVSVSYNETRLLEHLFRGLKGAKHSGARGMKRLLERMLLQPLAVELAGYVGDEPARVTITDGFYHGGRIQITA